MESSEPDSTASPVLAIGAVVVHPSGQVLLVRRGQPPLRGEWTILGGKVAPGETPAEAAVRETFEEAGLAVRALGTVGVVFLEHEGYRYEAHEIACTPVDPDAPLAAGDDATAVRWAPLGELAALGVRDEARVVLALGALSVLGATRAAADATTERRAGDRTPG